MQGIPAGVSELITVPGLRPEKMLRLYQDLGITSLDELEAAAKEDRVKKAKALGAALQTKILQNLPSQGELKVDSIFIAPRCCSSMRKKCFNGRNLIFHNIPSSAETLCATAGRSFASRKAAGARCSK